MSIASKFLTEPQSFQLTQERDDYLKSCIVIYIPVFILLAF